MSALAAWLRAQYGFGPRFARDAIALARGGMAELTTPATSREGTE